VIVARIISAAVMGRRPQLRMDLARRLRATAIPTRKMTMRFLLPAILLAAAAAAPAQSCSLAVSGGAPGSTLSISVTGAPMSIAAVAVGETAGTTVIDLGSLGSLTLGLAQPFVPVPLGIIDASGTASVSVTVPSQLPAADLVMQGVTVGITMMPFALSLCATNVASVHVGA
jgi:hypothetical protein